MAVVQGLQWTKAKVAANGAAFTSSRMLENIREPELAAPAMDVLPILSELPLALVDIWISGD